MQILMIQPSKTDLEVGTLYSHSGRFAGFAFSRDGNAIYSAAEDWGREALAST
jgi:hypothetical protein